MIRSLRLSLGLALASGFAASPAPAFCAPTQAEYAQRQLRLDTTQRALLDRYLSAVTAALAIPPPALATYSAMSTPERLATTETDLAVRLAAAETMEVALTAFYGSLDPEQKAAWNLQELRQMFGSREEGLPPDPAPYVEERSSAPRDVQPAWLTPPNADVIGSLYPHRMLQAGLGGQARIKCTVDVDGYLYDCSILSETPGKSGVGNAAIAMTAYARMRPAMRGGVRVESEIILPIRFNPQDAEPLAPPSGEGPGG